MTESEDLPRKGFAPLAPPAGSFDAVAGQARRRRLARVGLVGGSGAAIAAVLVVAVALTGGGGKQASLVTVATPSITETPSAAPTDSASPSLASTPSATPSDTVAPTPSDTSTPTPTASQTDDPTATPDPTLPSRTSTVPYIVPNDVFYGRAVDEQGNPIAGLYGLEVPNGPNTAFTTAADGTFSVPCRVKLELSSNPDTVSQASGPAVGNDALQYVGSTSLDWTTATPPPCTTYTPVKPLDVVFHEGAIVEGTVRDGNGQPLPAGTVLNGVRLKGTKGQESTLDWEIRLTVGAEGHYAITGVPTGVTVQMSISGPDDGFTLTPGQVYERDLSVCSTCSYGNPPASASPSATPSPSETP